MLLYLATTIAIMFVLIIIIEIKTPGGVFNYMRRHNTLADWKWHLVVIVAILLCIGVANAESNWRTMDQLEFNAGFISDYDGAIDYCKDGGNSAGNISAGIRTFAYTGVHWLTLATYLDVYHHNSCAVLKDDRPRDGFGVRAKATVDIVRLLGF